MKIGLSTNTLQIYQHQHLQKADGIGSYTAMLAKGLQNLGQRVVAVNYPTRPWFNTYQRAEEAMSLSFMDYDHFSWPFEISSIANTLLGIQTPGQKRLQDKIDVFHCTDYHQPILRRIPVVTTLHDAIFLQNPEWCRQRLRGVKNAVLRHLAKRATRIICVSQTAQEDVIKFFGVPNTKTSVIHHGVDPYWSKKIPLQECQTVCQRYGLQPNYLLFTGTIQPRKNVSRLIKAYQLLPTHLRKNIQLVVVGKPGWDHTAVQMLRDLNTKDTEVKWLDYVPRSDLRCLYQASRFVILPSLYEGFGFPVLEAFASQIPVIASNHSALAEICGKAALLVDPYEIKSLTTAMEALLTDHKLCEILIIRGNERLKQFSLETCLAKTLAVYQNA